MRLALSLLWSSVLAQAGEHLPIDHLISPDVETIERDVVIIGGGSSGSYAAVRLQQLGASVALIEKEDRLGGHTNTYRDAATGQTFDYGTQVLVNTTTVRDFFAHLGVGLQPFAPGGASVAVDFRAATPGPAWPVTNATAGAAALARYKVQLAQYPDTFFRGYHLPDPVPADLLLSWGDFLAKYDLGALGYDGFLQFQGMGNILAQSTLYMMKLFNPMQVAAREQKTKVHAANGNMQALWNSAQATLGDSVFLSATVRHIVRSDSGVTVTFTTPSGGCKVVHASQILLTVPPTLPILSPFLDLTSEETALFGQWNNSYYSNAVLADTSLPNMTSVYNYAPSAPLGIPALPGPYYFTATGVSQLYAVQYSSPAPYEAPATVEANLLASIRNVQHALGISASQDPRVVAFNDHSPFGLTVSTDAIAGGFYDRLTALEGPRRTWWTGGNWCSGSSSTIWDFTEVEILPAILKALGK